MSDLEKRVATEAIKQLKACYYRFLDTHHWAALETISTAEAVMDVSHPDGIISGEVGVYRGRAAIRAFAEGGDRRFDDDRPRAYARDRNPVAGPRTRYLSAGGSRLQAGWRPQSPPSRPRLGA